MARGTMEPIHLLSLGAGVQSSVMALMAARGEIKPMPTAAIFADTQSEPRSVYEWLDWLESQLPFPVIRVSKGSLEHDETRIRRSSKTGKLYLKGSIPAFVLSASGNRSLLGRKCTSDYKIIPIQRKVREITGVKRAGKGVVAAVMWIGISLDEIQRAKPSRVDYIQNRWPLLESRMSRAKCLEWMKQRELPQPPRSACFFCPFHSNSEWKRLKESEPLEFDRAVKFEKTIQTAAMQQEVLRGTPFLHRDCVPLSEVDLSERVSPQQQFDWQDECEGMCGV